ncbi:MAG: hypothetical protein OEX23_11290 [Betaproteobacteria bacterium]|jgi:hypothetical protein|nr:hypothetical protein [Betaproteobacteria bacterium]
MAKTLAKFAASWRTPLAAVAAALALAACAGGTTYVGVGVADPYFYGGAWYHDPWCCRGDVDIDIDIDGPGGRPETLPAPIDRPQARPQPLPSTRPSMPSTRPMPAARGGRR